MYGLQKCKDCGRLFEKKHPTMQVRCPKCQTKHRLEEDKKRKRRMQAMKKPKPDPNECKRKGSCIYGGRASQLLICDYLSITGHKRPCPVQGCTEYKRKGRKHAEQDNR